MIFEINVSITRVNVNDSMDKHSYYIYFLYLIFGIVYYTFYRYLHILLSYGHNFSLEIYISR